MLHYEVPLLISLCSDPHLLGHLVNIVAIFSSFRDHVAKTFDDCDHCSGDCCKTCSCDRACLLCRFTEGRCVSFCVLRIFSDIVGSFADFLHVHHLLLQVFFCLMQDFDLVPGCVQGFCKRVLFLCQELCVCRVQLQKLLNVPQIRLCCP